MGAVPPPATRWSNARKTECAQGHWHPSKVEARVCDRLTRDLDPGQWLARNIRLPLLALRDREELDGVPAYITIDFAVVQCIADRPPRILALVDAKTKGRVSRDWPARKRACELSYGIAVQECDQ